MKKYLCTLMIVVAALFMSLPVQSQILKFGIKGGINLTELDTNINGLKNNSMGYFVGPMVEITAPGVGLGVDGAIMYAQRGKDEMKMEGVEIPLNLTIDEHLPRCRSRFLPESQGYRFGSHRCYYRRIQVERQEGTGRLESRRWYQVG